MAKSREQLVDEMLDRDAIRDLPVRYCHYVWSGNLEGILGLFTEDGIFSTEGATDPVAVKGQAELRKFYGGAVERIGARPYIHNIVIDLKGATKATGNFYQKLSSDIQKIKWIGTDYYDDE